MAERRRIMLVEIKPRVPGARTYATWNPADKSANVTLANGNLDCYAAPTVFGGVRATVPMRSGQWYWELQQSVMPTSGYVSSGGMGVADAASLVSGNMGFDSSPIVTQGGPRANGSGQCYTGGVLTGTVGNVLVNDVLSFWFDADSGTLRVRRNGGAWQHLGRRPSLMAEPWFPMAQVVRNARYRANFGASAFVYAVPHGVNPGVFTVAASTVTTVYLGSEGFNTGPAESPANQHYMGRIARDPDFVTSREVSSWVWGGQTRSSRGQLSIVNNDGALDAWGEWEWRDAEVLIYEGLEGDDCQDFTLRSSERVESIKEEARGWTIALADQLAGLDVAMPRPTYRFSAANTQLHGEPVPVVLGRPLYCKGKRRATTGLGIDAYAWDLHDSPVRIDAVYDRGDIFPAIPANWAYTQDGLGFKLVNTPDEPVVANPAGPWIPSGADTITGANGGDFTSWAGIPQPVPAGWAQLGTAWAAGNRFQAGSPSGARLVCSGAQMVQMYNSATSLAAGDWRLTFTVAAVTTPGTVCFIVGGVNTYARLDRVGTFSIILRSGGGQLQFIGGHDGANALGSIDVTITTLRARSLTLIERLADWVRYLAFDLGGGFTLDTSATAALQASADYRLAHYSTSEETRLAILRATMDGWCGWLVPKLSGQLTVGRVDLPASTPVLTLTDAHVKTMRRSTDVAAGLTTRMAGRRNHTPHADSDIAGSVTAALREELTREYTVVRSSQPSTSYIGRKQTVVRESIVSGEVEQADGAKAKATLLQDADDIQAEISRVASLWREPRKFYDVECVLAAADADQLEPGQTVRVVWHRYGLGAGKNLLVLGVTTRFWSRAVTLKLWG